MRVLGLDQFTPPHQHGSSHGQSRVIRQAYFEDPAYVPLLLRTYELWRELESVSGQSLLTITGGLMLGREDSAVVAGSRRSANTHGLPHEMLEAREIRRRFPQFHPEPDTVALFERNAGFLRVEECVRAQWQLAAARGAELKFGSAVIGWSANCAGVEVETRDGNYQAGQLVISAGAWAAQLLADLQLPLVVERQVQLWFEPPGGIAEFLPEKFPVWIWQTNDGLNPYGLPAIAGPNGGVKTAIHHGGRNTRCTPATVDRVVSADEVEQARRCLATRVPALAGRCLDAVTCLYTNTPDEHFIVDRHPGLPRVIIVSPCSGHGFKFCPVIGEMVAAMVRQEQTPPGLFRIGRFHATHKEHLPAS
jgi:sarcosine oxidase